LCLGIYCQKDSKYYLKYVPDAEAKTDPMDDLIDLMVQRRRWINSSYFAFDYVFRNYSYDIKDSTHSWKSKSIFMPIIMLMSKANILNTYLTPALFFFALYTSVFQTYQQIVIPQRTAAGTIIISGWIIVPSFVCLGYITILTVMIGVCVNKSAK
jgi:cellulose synthase/poly-beta-1,6-N-acetylglucosamine synthase-like glycosyltransferase